MLYKRKGYDIEHFLSRQKHDDSNPYVIFPISFNMHSILHEGYYSIGLMDKYLVQT